MNDILQLKEEFFSTTANNKKSNILSKILSIRNIGINHKFNDKRTLLLDSVISQDVTSLKVLLERNANTNLKDENGYLPLYYAVINNNKKICNILLQNKSLLIDKDDDKNPLYIVCKNGYKDILEAFLENDVNKLTAGYMSKYMIVAIENKRYNIVDLLLQKCYSVEHILYVFNKLAATNDIDSLNYIVNKISLDDVIKSKSNHVFNISAGYKNYEMCDRLYALNFPLTNEYKDKTCMMACIIYDNVYVSNILLNKINVDDVFNEKTYLEHAINHKNGVLNLFLTRCDVNKVNIKEILDNFLHTSIRFSDIVNVRNMFSLNRYENLNNELATYLDDDSISLLINENSYLINEDFFMKCLLKGNVKSCSLMMKQDIVLQNFDNETWFKDLWAKNLNHKILHDLIERYLIKKESGDRNISLIEVVRLGDLTLFKKMIDKKADINFVDKNGISVLMSTVIYNRLDMFNVLMECNVNNKYENEDGMTALLYTCLYDRYDMFEILKYKSSLNVKEIKEVSKIKYDMFVQLFCFDDFQQFVKINIHNFKKSNDEQVVNIVNSIFNF